ncbi:MAG: hypothetical protein MAG453_01306 [Calditrichaeota bacterium]|nr:hypothetical protein [Calditrichota bacterium]
MNTVSGRRAEMPIRGSINGSAPLSRPGVDVYFAHPYRSCERARNENLNRIVRQWFPKQLDFRSLHGQDVQSVERSLNRRPRKPLG